jgi:DNA-binding SARP family transcriptional activator
VAAEVRIGVLGPVAVSGAARPFRRSAALELVAYLSLHRQGVASTEWPVAIWPDRAVSAATVHSTVSDARRALGRAVDGTWHLPHQGGHLRLSETVSCDVDRFAALESTGDPDSVIEAMRLVRGRLFGRLRRADWAVLDGTEAAVEGLVVGAALWAADRFMQAERADDATWVVRRALVVSPYDERLYRALLRATALQGNRLALHATMTQLLTLAGDVAASRTGRGRNGNNPSLTCVHPQTAALYRDLLRGAPAVGGVPSRL